MQHRIAAHLAGTLNARNAHAYLPTAVALGFVTVRDTLVRLAASGVDSMPRAVALTLPPDVLGEVVRIDSGGQRWSKGRVVVDYLRGKEEEGKLDEEMYRLMMRGRPSRIDEDLDAAEDEAGGDDDDDGICFDRKDASFLLSLAVRYESEAQLRRWVRRAAGAFSEVASEGLGRLPARVVTMLLGDDGLAVVEREDEVYRAAEAYVRERGEELTVRERKGVWGCVRFGLCSGEVQAALMELVEAKELEGKWLGGDKARERRHGWRRVSCYFVRFFQLKDQRSQLHFDSLISRVPSLLLVFRPIFYLFLYI